MTHLDDGVLLALRDGAASPSESEAAREHLASCARCAAALEAVESRGSAVADALASLDTDFDTAAARAAVRDRVTRQVASATGTVPLASSRRSGASRGRGGWIRAAGVVLFLGVASAAAALPRSPVHRWLTERLRPAVPGAATATEAPTAAAREPERTGIRLAAGDGPLRVILQDVAAGTDIEVRWVPGAEAAVFAPLGSRFTSATGRLEARLTPGPVRIELPRGVMPTTLVVGGRVYLTRSASGVEVAGPVTRRDDAGIDFRSPGS